MLARSTLNSIETFTSKPLIDYEISHKEQQSQRSDAEKGELNEEDKRNETKKINRENSGHV